MRLAQGAPGPSAVRATNLRSDAATSLRIHPPSTGSAGGEARREPRRPHAPPAVRAGIASTMSRGAFSSPPFRAIVLAG
jgi:hypothetical protein